MTTNECTPENPIAMEFPYLNGEQLGRVNAATAAANLLQAIGKVTESKIHGALGSAQVLNNTTVEDAPETPSVTDIISLSSWIIDGLDPCEHGSWILDSEVKGTYKDFEHEREEMKDALTFEESDDQEPNAGGDFLGALKEALARQFPNVGVEVLRLAHADGFKPCRTPECPSARCQSEQALDRALARVAEMRPIKDTPQA